MPRHPPCALKNLPHDHRTHRPAGNHPPHTPHHPQGQHDKHDRHHPPAAINHELSHPTHDPTGPHTGRAFLRCSRPLYSSQTTTHTPHTQAGAATRTPPAPRGAGNQRQHPPPVQHRDIPPPPPHTGRAAAAIRHGSCTGNEGPVVSGPNSAPWTSPPPDGTHRSTTTTPSVRRPRNTVAGTGEGPGRHLGCGRLPVDIPPMSSPHQEHDRFLRRGRPPHGGQRLLRKEVIQPHLPVRLPCYDLVPIASPTFDGSLPRGVRPPASGVTNFRDLTGGVYKARERIHRSVADLRLLATPTS